jgi:hypothetical protein
MVLLNLGRELLKVKKYLNGDPSITLEVSRPPDGVKQEKQEVNVSQMKPQPLPAEMTPAEKAKRYLLLAGMR